MPPLIAVLLSYGLGSIPAAYIAGRALRGIDLRQHGSGNLGATNVYRVMGPQIATGVMMFDVAKGAVPVLLFPQWAATTHPEGVAIACGLAAILGHVRPVFLLGRGGGKGIATAGGVFLALAPLPTLAATVVWLVVVSASGYVSLASLAAALALPLGVALESGVRSVLFIVSACTGAFVFWTHRANIRRLRRGEEHRFRRKSTA
jgi:acyl phosphate:glycerol-3-phosphate acyltransferase